MVTDYDVIKQLQEYREFAEKCEGQPRKWGGKLEEYYETIWAKVNKASQEIMDALQIMTSSGKMSDSPEYVQGIKDYDLYHGILIAFREAHPELKIWSEINLGTSDN